MTRHKWILRFTISSETSPSAVTTPWGGLLGQFHQPRRVFSKVARAATVVLALYWLLIFVGTHLPTTAMPDISMSDKLCHALAFCGLSFLLAWALPSQGKRLTHVVWAGLVALAYGCADELTQYFIPGRMCDFWDLVADGAGIIIGLSCYVVLRELLLQMKWGRSLLQLLSR